MSQIFEEYVQKTVAERMEEHDKEMARNLLQNGVSAELVRKSIPSLSLDDIKELSEQLALTK